MNKILSFTETAFPCFKKSAGYVTIKGHSLDYAVPHHSCSHQGIILPPGSIDTPLPFHLLIIKKKIEKNE